MSDQQNWRTDTNAQDYFGHQQKQLTVADRRPVIRNAADIVGPGIAAQAVPITDFNDLLATYNGTYSAVTGSSNAPNDDEDFVGTTAMDATMGGVQTFTGMESNLVFRRVFVRNPSDATFISWGAWGVVGGTPVGIVSPYAGTVAPEDWLICDGTGYSTTIYADLFAIIGYTYGGAGATFNVPDMRDRTVYGVGAEWTAPGANDGIAYGSRERSLPHGHTAVAGVTSSAHTHSGSMGPASAAGPNAQSGSGSTNANVFHDHALSMATDGAHIHLDGGTTGYYTSGLFGTAINIPGMGMNYIIRT